MIGWLLHKHTVVTALQFSVLLCSASCLTKPHSCSKTITSLKLTMGMFIFILLKFSCVFIYFFFHSLLSWNGLPYRSGYEYRDRAHFPRMMPLWRMTDPVLGESLWKDFWKCHQCELRWYNRHVIRCQCFTATSTAWSQLFHFCPKISKGRLPLNYFLSFVTLI